MNQNDQVLFERIFPCQALVPDTCYMRSLHVQSEQSKGGVHSALVSILNTYSRTRSLGFVSGLHSCATFQCCSLAGTQHNYLLPCLKARYLILYKPCMLANPSTMAAQWTNKTGTFSSRIRLARNKENHNPTLTRQHHVCLLDNPVLWVL